MSDAYLFVLHAPADSAYATALATELDGLPLAQGAAVQFGANVHCVQVWSGHGDLSNTPNNTIVCRLSDAPMPAALRALKAMNAQGDAAIDAATLRPLIAALQADRAEKATRARGAAPRLGAAAAPQEARKPSLAARSAYGMAATFAVAGVIGPMIMERAQATGTTSLPPSTEPAAAQPVAAAEPPTAAVVTQVSSTPALDQALMEHRTHRADVHPETTPADGATLVADVVAPARAPVADMLLAPIDALDLTAVAPMASVPKLAALSSAGLAPTGVKDEPQSEVLAFVPSQTVLP